MSLLRQVAIASVAAAVGLIGGYLLYSRFADSEVEHARNIFAQYLEAVGDDPSKWHGPIREKRERALARFTWIAPGARDIEGVDVLSGDQDVVCRWIQQTKDGKPAYEPCVQVQRR
ncbi:MAG: hypothetical protein ACOZCP_21370 [Pseudomonadota bacterium]